MQVKVYDTKYVTLCTSVRLRSLTTCWNALPNTQCLAHMWPTSDTVCRGRGDTSVHGSLMWVFVFSPA